MSYLLHIDATAFAEESISRRIARSFLDSWGGTEIVYRDLAATPVPHITAAGISARLTDRARHTPEQAAAQAVQDELLEEFLGAGGYLFTAPIYNYGVPSVLKAWIDQIAVSGRTIHLPDGPPTAGRPAVLISSRGGSYGPGEPHEGRDHLVPNVREILGVDMGLRFAFITSSWGLAEVLPMLSGLIPRHHDSLAAAHAAARAAGESFALHEVRAVPGAQQAATFTVA
ncbi:FMN-dependent NADH-azoreductase [Catenuloplanes nepalensis]|uniref:FMN dependent NADH:quinone oxidoreductase n=1 Tax=Catenuloplanes nepalensis TaxID=587533 RepID=A0ABT9MP62_9ACTN|nr:NAD(P)H-dependent oxidoreductase [Catenuloplanes nepalensis]MDP9793211.1 FMN-dependent NADH-azoreductase [Catenuloplanes nepalensis]